MTANDFIRIGAGKCRRSAARLASLLLSAEGLIAAFALIAVTLGALLVCNAIVGDRERTLANAQQSASQLARSIADLSAAEIVKSRRSLNSLAQDLYVASYHGILDTNAVERALETAKRYDAISTHLFVNYRDETHVVAYQSWLYRDARVQAQMSEVARLGPGPNGLVSEPIMLPLNDSVFLPILTDRELADGSRVRLGALVDVNSLIGPFRDYLAAPGHHLRLQAGDGGRIFTSEKFPGLMTGRADASMITAVAVAEQAPIQAVVGIERHAALAAWRAHSLTLAGISATAALALIALAAYLIRRARDEIRRAHRDPLTGLPNRVSFGKDLRAMIADKRFPRFAVLVIDLDRFKEINDSLGHHVGDLVLQEVARRMRAVLDEFGGQCARLGGDELAVLLPRAGSASEAMAASDRILAELSAPMWVKDLRLQVGASIGIAFYPTDGTDQVTLMREADTAMYHAKRNQLGAMLCGMAAAPGSCDQLALYAALAAALKRDEGLSLSYQPRVDLANGRASGLEALIRWQHPQRGLMRAADFIELARSASLTPQLARWVIDRVLAQIAVWRAKGQALPVSINLDPEALRHVGFIEYMHDALVRYRVPPALLEIELTEAALQGQPEITIERLARLRGLGIGLTIDDFGTGPSSLSLLRRLPVDRLKLDAQFVGQIAHSPVDAVLVGSTIAMAHALDMLVVAEGVTDPDVLAALRHLGCDAAQGYFLCQPLPVDEARAWIAARAAADRAAQPDGAHFDRVGSPLHT